MKATNITQIQEQINDIVALINSSLPPIQTKSEHFKNVIDTAAKNASSINAEIKRIERTNTRINDTLKMLEVAKEQRIVLGRCKDAF
ncbi:hypothetical protein QTN25_008408 [Entamoeba marina]